MKRAKTKSPPLPVTIDELRTSLRGKGLRSTGPRVAVLQCLMRAKSPQSHADIVADLQPMGFDPTTLYRNLIDLSEAGLVTRRDLGDHVWRFEMQGPASNHPGGHPHFVCTDCGEVSCLPDGSVKVMPMAGVFRAMAVDNLEVQLKGRCDRCD